MVLEVFRGVDDDHSSDDRNQRREQRAQAVEPKREGQIEGRRPFCCNAERPAAANDDEDGGEVDRKQASNQGGQNRAHNALSTRPADQGNCDEWRQDDGDVKDCG